MFALVLLVIGGLNWLLVGLFDFDLVAAIFGEMSGAADIAHHIEAVVAGLLERGPEGALRRGGRRLGAGEGGFIDEPVDRA